MRLKIITLISFALLFIPLNKKVPYLPIHNTCPPYYCEGYVEVIHERTIASYYHDKFNGRKTASGSIFSNKNYTAAHKTLPFGTKVRVTNLKNGKEVVVVINDRGPFIKGRKIDLSKRAFKDIAEVKKGTAIVRIEKL